MNKLTIIGGGMTGLAAAYIAAKQGKQVTILEGSDKVGGLLNTFEIGGSQLEHYYHHFFTQDAELHWLMKELGIADKTFYKKTTMGQRRQNQSSSTRIARRWQPIQQHGENPNRQCSRPVNRCA